jgi:hypothetical protein
VQDADLVLDVVEQRRAHVPRAWPGPELAVPERQRSRVGVGAEMMHFDEHRYVPRSRMRGHWRSECYSAGSERRHGSLGKEACLSVVATHSGGFTSASHADFTWWSISEGSP